MGRENISGRATSAAARPPSSPCRPDPAQHPARECLPGSITTQPVIIDQLNISNLDSRFLIHALFPHSKVPDAYPIPGLVLDWGTRN